MDLFIAKTKFLDYNSGELDIMKEREAKSGKH